MSKSVFDDINSSKDAYYLSLLLIMLFSRSPRYFSLPELLLTLDKDNFMRFISVFEGQTITVPPKQDIIDMIQSLGYYYYTEYEGMSRYDAKKKLDIADLRQIDQNVSKIKSNLDNLKLPDNSVFFHD